MSAQVLQFPARTSVRAIPVDEDDMALPTPVRQLLAIMEETERRLGSVGALNGLDSREHLRICVPPLG